MSVNIRIWCQVRSPIVRSSVAAVMTPETADHAFRHEQPRSYDTAAKAQRNQRYSHETGNHEGARELERQPPPGEIKQLIRGHTLPSFALVQSPAQENS